MGAEHRRTDDLAEGLVRLRRDFLQLRDELRVVDARACILGSTAFRPSYKITNSAILKGVRP